MTGVSVAPTPPEKEIAQYQMNAVKGRAALLDIMDIMDTMSVAKNRLFLLYSNIFCYCTDNARTQAHCGVADAGFNGRQNQRVTPERNAGATWLADLA
jgi:hypothetical protein